MSDRPFNPWRDFWHPFLRNVAVGWALVAFIMILVTVQGATAATPNDAVVRAWLFNNNLTDATGNSDATGNGVVGYTTGKIGEAISVGSGNNWKDASPYNLSNKPGGISAWLKYTSASFMIVSMQKRQTATSCINFYVYANSGKLGLDTTNGTVAETTGTYNDNTYHHIVATWDATRKYLYIDGALAVNVSGGAADACTPEYTGPYNDANPSTQAFVGAMDEFIMYNKTLTPAEVSAIFAAENASIPYPWSSAPTVTPILPVDNDHTNDVPLTFQYNATTNVGSMNCSLYINSTLNETHTGLGNVTDTFNVSLTDGLYSWFISCVDANGETNSSTRTVVIDTISPDWTINPSNFFAADNTTVLNPLLTGEVYNYNLTLQDAYIFAYNVTIFNSTGGIMTTLQVTNSTAEEVNITSAVNVTTWPSANYTVQLYAEDDHTARWIDPYAYSMTANSIVYQTGTNRVEIQSEVANLRGLTTEKLDDRYTFGFETTANRAEWAFNLMCDAPIYDRGSLYEWPTFVCGKHWVDFVPADTTGVTGWEVRYLDAQKVNVKFYLSGRNKLDFHSLGGLNVVNESYSFAINRTPVQSNNLTSTATGTDWIALSWTNDATATGATLYRDNNPLANLTNTTYNDTGLSSGATYTYKVLAYYNESGTLNYNASTSFENQISVATIFNGTLAVEVRNAVTDTIITGDLFFINLIGSVANQTVNTTTGFAALTNITTDNYTVRVTGEGWGSRDIYTTIEQNQSENVIARLLNDTTRTGGVVSVVDTNGDQQSGAIVKLLRYLPNQNAYEIVQAITTVSNGQNTMDGQLYDAYYKFVVELDGVTYFTSLNPETLFPGADGLWRRTFTINPGTNYYESYQNRNVLNTTFTNTTVGNDTTLVFTWNDPAGIVNKGCLQTRGRTGAAWDEWTQTCGNGATGSVFITLNDTNVQRYQYAAVVYYSTSWSAWTKYNGYLDPIPRYDFGVLGSLLGAILLGGLVLLFSYSAVAVMIISAAGILILSLLTFLPFTTTFVIGLSFMVLGLGIYFMRS